MANKPLLYGGGAVVALIIVMLIWMKSRGRKQSVAGLAAATSGLSSGRDFIDPLAPAGGYSATTNVTSTGLETALSSRPNPGETPDFAVMGGDLEEEVAVVEAPPPAVVRPKTDEDDMVSLDAFDSGPVAAVEASQSLETTPPNIDRDVNPAPQLTPTKGSSSMDADLEALLRGSFDGADPEPVSIPDRLEPALEVAGASAAAAASNRVIFQQNFNDEAEDSSPAGWQGEYDYAGLSVTSLDESAHSKCLKFEKGEGVGSAIYHVTFPPAKGQIIVEFDIRCDDKNKFLLGIYLEKDEDFKQSVHTIVHHLDPNGPASLRVQGQAVPYQMETWCHMRYEIDLVAGLLSALVDGEHIAQDTPLAVAPDYFNTLSIRDNLATTGTLYLDNIRISEA